MCRTGDTLEFEILEMMHKNICCVFELLKNGDGGEKDRVQTRFQSEHKEFDSCGRRYEMRVNMKWREFSSNSKSENDRQHVPDLFSCGLTLAKSEQFA